MFGCGVRALGLVAVPLPAGRGVDLVAAHHQHLPARQRWLAVQRDAVLGEEIGDRVRRVEAVAEVGHEVEPELLAARTLREDRRGQLILQVALVQILAEDIGEQHLCRGVYQHQRTQPVDRFGLGESEFFVGVRAGAAGGAADGHEWPR
jgi:hypothetical protein